MPDKKAKVLFFGDTIGKPGRNTLKKCIPELVQEFSPDLVIVNVENIAHGKGVTINTMKELDGLGIDVYTSGNHVFDKGELSKEPFEKYLTLIRPANYVGDFAGKGFVRISKNGHDFLVANLNAQVFFEKQFPGQISSPFVALDEIFKDQVRPEDTVIVDFHSEATSEKRALGFYADGRAGLVVGTHTHVASADLQILPKGTGYVSDVGMTGALNSIIGVPVENSLQIFLGGKFVFAVEENNPIMLNAVYAEFEKGKAVKVQKIYKEVNL